MGVGVGVEVGTSEVTDGSGAGDPGGVGVSGSWMGEEDLGPVVEAEPAGPTTDGMQVPEKAGKEQS